MIGTEKEWRNLERKWDLGHYDRLKIREKEMLAELTARAEHRAAIASGRVVRYEDGRGTADVVYGNPLSAELSVRGHMSNVERRFHPNGWPKEHPQSNAVRGRLLGPRGGVL